MATVISGPEIEFPHVLNLSPDWQATKWASLSPANWLFMCKLASGCFHEAWLTRAARQHPLTALAECLGCAGDGDDGDSPALLQPPGSPSLALSKRPELLWAVSTSLQRRDCCPASSWQEMLSQAAGKRCGEGLSGKHLPRWSRAEERSLVGMCTPVAGAGGAQCPCSDQGPSCRRVLLICQGTYFCRRVLLRAPSTGRRQQSSFI